jgi:hypothetical protein
MKKSCILYVWLGLTWSFFVFGAMKLILFALHSHVRTIFITAFIIVIGSLVAEISPAKGWRPFRHFGEKNEKKA